MPRRSSWALGWGLASVWCRQELNLARCLNTRPFGAFIEDPKVEDVPADLARDWQLVRLGSDGDHVMMRAILPIARQEVYGTFSAEGLRRLKRGLEQVGLDAKFFA
jgi:hypothetical protein